MTYDMYVIDTETTGLEGFPYDHVVDIGICGVDFSAGTVEDLYDSVVGYDVTKWTDRTKNAWIFRNTDLTVEDVAKATPLEDVVKAVRWTILGGDVTSYNTPFDFSKFLLQFPWNLGDCAVLGDDIMDAATVACKIPSPYGYDDWKWPSLMEAYALVDGDPAGIRKHQDHRALSDARVASYVLLELIRRGFYKTGVGK